MSVKIVIAHHPYEAQREDEISFAKDEVIKVTDFSDPDWWVGKKKDGSLGFFPSNFVSEKEEESAVEPKEDTTQTDKENIPPQPVADTEEKAPVEDESNEAVAEEKPTVEEKKDQVIGMARVMEDYAMQESGELTLHRGGIVNVYEVIDDEWSRGELNGKVGKYPHKYVEDIDMPGGRPDLGKQTAPSDSHQQQQGEDDAPKGGFKLAAFGVKQGGIGSLLAGGFPGLKKTGGVKSTPAPAAAPEPKPVVEQEEPKHEEPKPVEANPVEPVEQESPVQQQQQAEEAPKQKSLGKAIVLHPYDAESEDELSLLRGEYVEILDRNVDEGWWKGLNERGQSGVFPNNFVREIDEESIAAPPTPTRARRSVQSVNSTSSTVSPTAPAVPGNRPPSINNTTMARPPQVPRPSSVQTPATARPISVQPPAQRPSSISHTNSSTLATPPKIAAAIVPPPQQQVTSPTIAEEEARDAEEEDEVTSPIVEKVQSPPPVIPSPVERKPSLTSQDSIDAQLAEREIPTSAPFNEEAIKSPPVVPEDPISDQEEKESGAEELASPAITPAAPVAAVTREIVEQKEEPKHDVDVAEKEDVKEEKKKEEPITAPQEPLAAAEPVVEDKKEDEDEKQPEEEIKKDDEEDEFKDAKETEEEEKPAVTEEEEKKELDIIPSGPKLTTPARARIGGGRARRSPSSNTTAQEPSQTEILQKEILEQKEEPKEEVEEEPKKESPSPPAKPVKPIFAKFPTPFAGAGISKSHLKPTQTRKLWDDKPEEKAPSVTADNEDPQPVKPSGVKNIASRFNFAGNTSGGSNEVLETKLKNHTKNEVEKVRKEFEQLLNEEREKRLALESIVQELLEKVKSFEQ